jgi:hypothetical protein
MVQMCCKTDPSFGTSLIQKCTPEMELIIWSIKLRLAILLVLTMPNVIQAGDPILQQAIIE